MTTFDKGNKKIVAAVESLIVCSNLNIGELDVYYAYRFNKIMLVKKLIQSHFKFDNIILRSNNPFTNA
jgi:hypothetical protein